VKLVGGDIVETLVSHDVLGRLMLVSVRQPGLAKVYEALLGSEGEEFYMKEWEELEGQQSGDLIGRFPDAVPIGVQTSEVVASQLFDLTGGEAGAGGACSTRASAGRVVDLGVELGAEGGEGLWGGRWGGRGASVVVCEILVYGQGPVVDGVCTYLGLMAPTTGLLVVAAVLNNGPNRN
jgi:hypothetical protein